ncbi:3-oxoacyl-[acyl-carrier-protein] reductase FabG-like [Aricia agestis]|uniref:3-oxoacyl-[acyl-carrier-protein] reductase FabG-like n=1 Tax=Aricia agestis TaxID=91739 RepID=UPI001C205743|nr:3-oxoacyl-[acyl-carrier-protein] reductase FabG-like [Aricia agestis]
MDFSEKVVLITGAGSGIGAATAIHFSKLSAKLVLVDKKGDNLKRIALYCERAKSIKPLTIVADLTEDLDVERIVKETIEQTDKLDVLVNNAGIIAMGGIKKTDMESFDKVISTNVRSVYHLTMLCVPHLVNSKGCVINVSSISSSKPNTMSLAYNMSKAALDQFTKCTALELAADGVRVNSVNVGFVKTNLFKDTGLTEDQLDMFCKNNACGTPLKRIVEGEEVANLISFLASDIAKSITGSCYVIDGGKSLA